MSSSLPCSDHVIVLPDPQLCYKTFAVIWCNTSFHFPLFPDAIKLPVPLLVPAWSLSAKLSVLLLFCDTQLLKTQFGVSTLDATLHILDCTLCFLPSALQGSAQIRIDIN